VRIFIGKIRYAILVAAAVAAIAVLSYNAQVHSANSPASKTSSPIGGKLIWMEFDEGMEKAAKENKLLLVDVYTDWCHWCKEMDKNVYTDQIVIDLINEKFIPIKLDAESDEKIHFNDKTEMKHQWAASMGVTGYPTTIFLEPNGKPITLLPGYIEAKLFLDVLGYVSSNAIKEDISFALWQKDKH
jgi:uncharacterized protein YyaL (SSP411 family)